MIMQNEVLAIEQLIIYADASAKLADDYRALLKKIWDRANPSTFEDAGETRLDPDIFEELDTILHGDTGQK